MSDEQALIKGHPEGEPETGGMQPSGSSLSLDTFAGKIQFRWAPEAEVSSLGQMAFFIEFLKTSGLFENWVKDCPLKYTSANAPQKRDVLGTILLSVLAGHWRYAHISALRGDGVNPELLGMSKVASEDSVRRGLAAMKDEESEAWLKKHLQFSYQPLLEEPWALDVDTTVKPLYGCGAVTALLRWTPGRCEGGIQSAKARAPFARLSQLFHRELKDGNGRGSPSGESDGGLICAAGVVVVAGRTAEGELSEVSARRLPMGNGAGDGRSRAAGDSLCVQAEAEPQCEKADREANGS
jgi:hypothetical protein